MVEDVENRKSTNEVSSAYACRAVERSGGTVGHRSSSRDRCRVFPFDMVFPLSDSQ